MKSIQLPGAAVLLCAATLMFPRGLRAADMVWINTGGGNWNVAANWNPSQVPGAADNAYITNNGTYTVTLNVAATIASLTLGGASGTQTFTNSGQTLTLNGASTVRPNGVFSLGGTLTGPGDLTANGPLIWSGGTMSGSGTTFANGGLTISGPSGKTLTGRTLVNAGAATWSEGLIFLNNGSVLSNAVNRTFDCAFDGSKNSIAGSGTVANAGTFRKTAGANATTVNSPIVFNNTGTVTVQSGILNLNGGGTHTGNFTLASGATNNLGGGTHNLANVNISGAGVLSVNGGTANFTDTLGFTSALNVSGRAQHANYVQAQNYVQAHSGRGVPDSLQPWLAPPKRNDTNGGSHLRNNSGAPRSVRRR